MKKKILHITVNFKNWDITKKLIKSLDKNSEVELTLFVVDNCADSSSDKFINEIEVKNITLQIIKSKNNLGYFGAASYVLSNLNYLEFDFIIISNNDIEVIQNNFYSILFKYKTYDIIAPSIRTLNGIEQNPHRINPISKIRKIYYSIYFSSYIVAYILNSLIKLKKSLMSKIDNVDYSEPFTIFSPHGAYLIFNKTYFIKGGFIDNGFFLYGEEDSIAAISFKHKFNIIFAPELKIIHHESITIGRRFSRIKFTYQKETFKYLKKKYPYYYKI